MNSFGVFFVNLFTMQFFGISRKFIGISILSLGFLLALPGSIYAHVLLENPPDSAQYAPGEVITIKWSNILEHDGISFELYFSTDSAATFIPIKTGIPTTQFTYDWTVPDNITNKAAIKVVQNNGSVDYIDYNYFIITNTPYQMNIITELYPSPENSNSGLISNYPNPSFGSSTIEFNLPSGSNVALRIFDSQGKLVTTLIDDRLNKGTYKKHWDAADLPKGLYFIRLDSRYIHDSRIAVIR